jgi:hypothetical protein
MSIEKGLALSDIITELNTSIALMEMPAHVRVFLLDHLAEIEQVFFLIFFEYNYFY